MDDLLRMFRAADEAGVRLALSSDAAEAVRGDAVLFEAIQVPLVAMSILASISGRRSGEPVYALGARVGNLLMAAFPAFTKTRRYLQWSIRVRSVTAGAIGFLEMSGLVHVAVDDKRRVILTERGRDFVEKVRSSDEAGELLSSLLVASKNTRTRDPSLL